MVFFCMQKTAYEMRISDWSSDVCSSDLRLAWMAAKASAISVNELVLEPSAGTGMLGVWAAKAAARLALNEISPLRRESSEERRVGKECVSTCSSRWSPYH